MIHNICVHLLRCAVYTCSGVACAVNLLYSINNQLLAYRGAYSILLKSTGAFVRQCKNQLSSTYIYLSSFTHYSLYT